LSKVSPSHDVMSGLRLELFVLAVLQDAEARCPRYRGNKKKAVAAVGGSGIRFSLRTRRHAGGQRVVPTEVVQRPGETYFYVRCFVTGLAVAVVMERLHE
jgi:hypothetical protein